MMRRCLGKASFHDICDEYIVVNEPESYDVGPSIFLPRQLENITRLGPETFQAAEDERVHGGKGVHRAVEAFRIRNVTFKDAGLYKRNWSFYFPKLGAKPPSGPVHVEGGSHALVSSYSGIQYFGHWLRDDSTTYLLAEQFASPFCVRTPDWPHCAGYNEIFSLDWPFVDTAHFDELFFFFDYAQNSHKVSRYRELRQRLRQRVKPINQGHRVYLRRGDTGAIKRTISNEAEVSKALEDNGFIILDITKDDINTIVTTLLEARVFVSIEGSHADHALYTIADRAAFLAIVPPNMFNNLPKDWTAALGMEYGFVVGEHDGAAFKVNIPDLLTTIDMMEAVL